jgi:integrase
MNTTLPNFTPRHYQPVSFPVMAMLKTAQVHIMEDATRLSLAQGIKELMASKRTANRRENYIESLGHYLGRFAKGRESKMISEIQVFDLELWLSQFTAPYSRQTWFNRINTLFSFSLRRGYIQANPCDRVERITIDRKAPFILSPDQAEKMMAMTTPLCRPYIILGLYAGIRPEELLHVTWENICLETNTVRLEHTKTRRRRIVPLEPRAVALLADCPNKAGRIAPCNTTVRRLKRRIGRALGFKAWPQDLLRHTAASYLLALIGDAGKVAMKDHR